MADERPPDSVWQWHGGGVGLALSDSNPSEETEVRRLKIANGGKQLLAVVNQGGLGDRLSYDPTMATLFARREVRLAASLASRSRSASRSCDRRRAMNRSSSPTASRAAVPVSVTRACRRAIVSWARTESDPPTKGIAARPADTTVVRQPGTPVGGRGARGDSVTAKSSPTRGPLLTRLAGPMNRTAMSASWSQDDGQQTKRAASRSAWGSAGEGDDGFSRLAPHPAPPEFPRRLRLPSPWTCSTSLSGPPRSSGRGCGWSKPSTGAWPLPARNGTSVSS